MSNTAYKIFVMQASESGCEIECKYKVPNQCCYFKDNSLLWNWLELDYRIKLPERFEYLIEDGELVFREPKKGEWFLNRHYYEPRHNFNGFGFGKLPIIKRINT